MSEQLEALRLADLLEMGSLWPDQEAAARELRRLHDEVESLRQAYNIVTDDCRNLTEKVIPNIRAQRDALLEEISALREVLLYSLDNQGRYRKKHQKIVDAAIKAVELSDD